MEDETDYEYGLRLIEIKVEQNPEDLEWSDVVSLTNLDVHYDSLRKAANVTPYSGYNVMKYFKEKYAACSADNSSAYLSELEHKLYELQKERQRFYDQRSALNKIIRERARQEELNDILLSAIENNDLPNLSCSPHEVQASDNDILVSLNDIHYGAVVDNYWNVYNPDICADMFNQYVSKILDVASRHGSENCIIWSNGDAISGSIHHSISVTNKESVIKQIMGVSELIAQFIARLSPHFKTIRYMSVAGNHSRIDTKDRALQDERLDDIPEWYLKARLQNITNVIFNDYEKIDPTMYLAEIRGKTYLGVHGDYEATTSKVQSLVTMAQRPVYSILSGHKHHNKLDTVQGVKTIMAGSFLGIDSFAASLRIFGKPEQLISVVDRNGFLCHYDVQFNN